MSILARSNAARLELEAIHLFTPSSQHAPLCKNLEYLGMARVGIASPYQVTTDTTRPEFFVTAKNSCVSFTGFANPSRHYPECKSIVFRTDIGVALEDLVDVKYIQIVGEHRYALLKPHGLSFDVIIHELPSSVPAEEMATILDPFFHLVTLKSPAEQRESADLPHSVDHIALAVKFGDLDPSIAWFEQHLGATRQLSPGESFGQGIVVAQAGHGMRMKTLRLVDFYIVIVEPLKGLVGQVHDYIERHGAGLQHIALLTSDIVAAVDRFRVLSDKLQLTEAKKTASEVILAKSASYIEFFERVVARRDRGLMMTANIPDDLENRSQFKLLTQVFTQPINNDTEMFFELIERTNYVGFAPANIGQLFDSLRSDMNVLFVDEQLGSVHFDQWNEAQNSSGFVIRAFSLGLTTEEALIAYLHNTQVHFDVIISSFVPITARVLDECCRKPRLVHAQGSGHDHIDKDACAARNISVCNNVDWSGQEVAEHAVFVLGALALDLRGATSKMERGSWDRSVVKQTIEGSNLLIVGIGNIGRRVLVFAEALGMRVTVYDPPAGYDSDLHELLPEADFVSIHVPLTPETESLFSFSEFVRMKPTARIVNTSRGGVIDEDALLEALDSGKIAGAALDVFRMEPLERTSRLRAHPKIIATPHTAGLTEQSKIRAAKYITDNLMMLFQNKPLQNNLLVRNVPMKAAGTVMDIETSVSIRGRSSGSSNYEIDDGPSIDSSRHTPDTTVYDSPGDKNSTTDVIIPKAYAHLKTMRDIFDMIKATPSDVEVYNLAAGMVEISPSSVLRRLAAEAVVETTTSGSVIPITHMYRERTGDAIYREGIVNLCREHYKAPADCIDEMVLATSGVSGAITSIISAWRTVFQSSSGRQLKPGKFQIGLFSPYYIYHAEIAESLYGINGFEQTTMPLLPDGRHDIPALNLLLSRTRMDCIITTNPGNPSGRRMTEDERDMWLQIITRYPDTWFVFDEVYADMIYDGEFVSFQVPFPNNLFVTRGFSKTLAVGAWRLGYVLSDPSRRQDIAREHDRMYLCANWTQLALGRYILSHKADYLDFIDKWRKRLAHNKAVISGAFLKRFGWSTRPSEGSMYILINHNDAGGDWAAFARVLETCKVATAPGSIFSAEQGALRIQLAFEETKADDIAKRILSRLE